MGGPGIAWDKRNLTITIAVLTGRPFSTVLTCPRLEPARAAAKLSPSMTTSRMSRGFCYTLPPRGFQMRHFALAEKVFACVTTKARVLTNTMEPCLSGSTTHLCGGLRTMIRQSNSRATAGGRAPNQHVGDRLHPTGRQAEHTKPERLVHDAAAFDARVQAMTVIMRQDGQFHL